MASWKFRVTAAPFDSAIQLDIAFSVALIIIGFMRLTIAGENSRITMPLWSCHCFPAE